MQKQTEIVNDNYEMKLVDITNLEHNKLNPNEMDIQAMGLLRNNIMQYGYIEFIVVVEIPNQPDKFLIIDGAHRTLVLEELEEKDFYKAVHLEESKRVKGKKMIPVIIAKNIDYNKALLGAYTFNKARGSLNPHKIALLLLEGLNHMDEKDVIKASGLTKAGLYEYTAMLKENETKMLEDDIRSNTVAEEIVKKELKELQAVNASEFKKLLMLPLVESNYNNVTAILTEFGADFSTSIVKLVEEYKKLLHEVKELRKK